MPGLGIDDMLGKLEHVFGDFFVTVLCAAVVYLFVIEPRSKIHDL
jgi:hypothetical protein